MRTRNSSSPINHISNDYGNDEHSSKRVLSTPTTTTTAATATPIYDDEDNSDTGSNTSQDKPISNKYSGNDYDNHHYNDDNKHPIGLRQFE